MRHLPLLILLLAGCAIPATKPLHFALGGGIGLSLAPLHDSRGYVYAGTVGATEAVYAEMAGHRLGFSPSKQETNEHLISVAVGGFVGGVVWEWLR